MEMGYSTWVRFMDGTGMEQSFFEFPIFTIFVFFVPQFFWSSHDEDIVCSFFVQVAKFVLDFVFLSLTPLQQPHNNHTYIVIPGAWLIYKDKRHNAGNDCVPSHRDAVCVPRSDKSNRNRFTF